MNKSYFLWPGNSFFRALRSLLYINSVVKIEAKLKEIFPSGYPVLCSSGRSALALALIQNKVSRHNFIGVFPFANHCVLDIISRFCSPLLGPDSVKVNFRIVHHQLGFVQEENLRSNTIEDCVDTLCVRGAKLFPGGGSFEIWSLPKILGTTSGGVLWCRNKKDAVLARQTRDLRGGGMLPWLVRLFGKLYPHAYFYWQGAEGNLGRMSIWQTGEIYKSIINWDNFVIDRSKKLDMIWPYAVRWLKKPIERLPSAVPVELNIEEQFVKKLGVLSGYRMFESINSVGKRKIKRVLPIPIHQDVPEFWMLSLIKNFTLKKRKH